MRDLVQKNSNKGVCNMDHGKKISKQTSAIIIVMAITGIVLSFIFRQWQTQIWQVATLCILLIAQLHMHHMKTKPRGALPFSIQMATATAFYVVLTTYL